MCYSRRNLSAIQTSMKTGVRAAPTSLGRPAMRSGAASIPYSRGCDVTEQPTFRRFANLDRVVHEPARLAIMAALYTMESADFLYLLQATGLSKGNLSSHLMKLEGAGYVEIEKSFRGKVPQTVCTLTQGGRQAFHAYRQRLRQVVDTLAM